MTIYRTKEVPGSWIEIDDGSLNEGMLGKFKGKRSLNFKLRIVNKRLSYSQILHQNEMEQHMITNMDVISLYGSEDGVLNREKYLDYRGNLPKSTEEIIIEGGNHAGFGSYGLQDGDGESLISGEDQVEITADALANFISRIGNRRIKN